MRALSHRTRTLIPAIAILAIVFNLGAKCGGGPGQPPPHMLFLDTPITGTFTNDATILVTGHTNRVIPTITVNGVVTPLVANQFSATASTLASSSMEPCPPTASACGSATPASTRSRPWWRVCQATPSTSAT